MYNGIRKDDTMNWIKQFNSLLDYIEENITNTILVEEISKSVNYSYFHLSRMFHIVAGMNISDYIRKRRLALAGNEIITSNIKVIDLAYKYQYSTPESFSKAFKNFHGISPMEVKRKSTYIKSFPRLSFQIKINGGNVMEYKIVKKEEMRFIGIERTFTTIDGSNYVEIPKMWKEVTQKDIFTKLLKLSDEMCVVGVCHSFNNDTSEFKYMIGIRNIDKQIEGLQEVLVEPATYAIFKSVGPLPSAFQETIKRVYSEWFPSNNYEHAGKPDLEVYSDGDSNSADYECEMWIPIIEKE